MKKSKKFIIMSVVFVLTIVVAVGIYFFYGKKMQNAVTITGSMYMFDTSTPEKAVGISDYVFVAKINKIARTEYRDPVTIETGLFSSEVWTTPYTYYEIEVVKNIKGELIASEPIEYMQYGGINEDGETYTFMEGTGLLETGKYYILMADTFGGDGGIIEVTEPNRRILLDDVENDEDVENSELVKRYEEAYKNEYIPEGFYNWERYTSKYDVNYKE